jgi:hypothetical protein
MSQKESSPTLLLMRRLAEIPSLVGSYKDTHDDDGMREIFVHSTLPGPDCQ